MKAKEIISGILFTTALLFMSGADANPLWVTTLGVALPLLGMLSLHKDD